MILLTRKHISQYTYTFNTVKSKTYLTHISMVCIQWFYLLVSWCHCFRCTKLISCLCWCRVFPGMVVHASASSTILYSNNSVPTCQTSSEDVLLLFACFCLFFQWWWTGGRLFKWWTKSTFTSTNTLKQIKITRYRLSRCRQTV